MSSTRGCFNLLRKSKLAFCKYTQLWNVYITRSWFHVQQTSFSYFHYIFFHSHLRSMLPCLQECTQCTSKWWKWWRHCLSGSHITVTRGGSPRELALLNSLHESRQLLTGIRIPYSSLLYNKQQQIAIPHWELKCHSTVKHVDLKLSQNCVALTGPRAGILKLIQVINQNWL